MLVKGQAIRLRKLRASDNPFMRTPVKEEHTPGKDNPLTSLPIDYEMEGVLSADVEEGKSLHMLRTKRNGIEVPGITQTSAIVSVNVEEDGQSLILETENSIYLVENI